MENFQEKKIDQPASPQKQASLSMTAVVFIFTVIYLAIIIAVGGIFLFFKSSILNKLNVTLTNYVKPSPVVPTSIPTVTPIPITFINYTLDELPKNANAIGVQVIPGRINNALSFKGDGFNQITVENQLLKKIKDEFTISLWVNNLGNKGSTLIWMSDIDNDGVGISIGDHGQIYCETVDGITGRIISSLTNERLISLNKDKGWHHISAVMEDFHCSIYVDGVIKTSEWRNHDNLGVTDFSHLTFGGDPDGKSLFKGYLDDVRIYNYARSPEQIKKDMAGLN